jgi:hypothetical protein
MADLQDFFSEDDFVVASRAGNPQESFARAIEKQIEKNEKGETKGSWCEAKGGRIEISPKWNGNVIKLNFNGKNVKLSANTQSEIIGKLQGLLKANEAGVFDEQLAEIQAKKAAK